MRDDNIGLSHQMQRLAEMTQLSARLLARLAPQAAGAGQLALEPVAGSAGRRFATVMAVLGQPRLQVTHTLGERSVLFQQVLQALAQLHILGSQDCGFVVRRHACMLHPLPN